MISAIWLKLRSYASLRARGVEVSPLARIRIGDPKAVRFGRSCHIGSGAIVSVHRAILSLGDGVIVGDNCNIRADGANITIDDNVRLAQFVSIIGANHSVAVDGSVLDSTEDSSGVRIGQGSWLGVGAIILPGVVLGARCVVGAGSVVTKSFPDGSKIVGNPARRID